MPHSKNSPTKLKAAARRGEALDLRIQGLTYRQIGERMGVSETRAYQLVGDAVAVYRVDNTAKAEQLRAVMTAQLESLVGGLWPQAKAGDVKAVGTLVGVFNRLARLHGLDAPAKVQAQAGGDPYGVSKMSDAELIEYARRVGIPLPDDAASTFGGKAEQPVTRCG
jgi:DNA-binding CsgD family transcriptional regulator